MSTKFSAPKGAREGGREEEFCKMGKFTEQVSGNNMKELSWFVKIDLVWLFDKDGQCYRK